MRSSILILLPLFVVSFTFGQSDKLSAFQQRLHFENFAYPFIKHGKFGLITSQGVILQPPVYDKIFPIQSFDFAKKKGVVYKLNTKGEIESGFAWKNVYYNKSIRALIAVKLSGDTVYLPHNSIVPFKEFTHQDSLKQYVTYFQSKFEIYEDEIGDSRITIPGYRQLLLRNADKSLLLDSVYDVFTNEDRLYVYTKEKLLSVYNMNMLSCIFQASYSVAFIELHESRGRTFFCLKNAEGDKVWLADSNYNKLMDIEEFHYFIGDYCLATIQGQKTFIDLFNGQLIPANNKNYVQYQKLLVLKYEDSLQLLNENLEVFRFPCSEMYNLKINSNLFLIGLQECVDSVSETLNFRPTSNHQFSYWNYVDKSLLMDSMGKILYVFPYQFNPLDKKASVGMIVKQKDLMCYVKLASDYKSYQELDYDFLNRFGENWLAEKDGKLLLLDSNFNKINLFSFKSYSLLLNDKDDWYVPYALKMTIGEQQSILTLSGKQIPFSSNSHLYTVGRSQIRSVLWFATYEGETDPNGYCDLYTVQGEKLGNFKSASFYHDPVTDMLICTHQKKNGDWEVRYYNSKGKLVTKFNA